MAKLFGDIWFNPHGYDYGRSLTVLDDTLTAAERGLEERRSAIQAEYDAYEASGKRLGEWEEDGKIWDQADVYEFDLELVDECIAGLRKSYVIALYHSWERMVGRWAKVSARPDHVKLCAAVEKMGVKIHPRLDAVRDLNNALKHNSRVYGPRLLTSWKEMLPPGFVLPDNYETDENVTVDWFSLITIGSEQMREIIAALRASGPDAFPPNHFIPSTPGR